MLLSKGFLGNSFKRGTACQEDKAIENFNKRFQNGISSEYTCIFDPLEKMKCIKDEQDAKRLHQNGIFYKKFIFLLAIRFRSGYNRSPKDAPPRFCRGTLFRFCAFKCKLKIAPSTMMDVEKLIFQHYHQRGAV